MKKSFLAVLLAIALVSPVFAAEKNMWVGGSFGYSSNNKDVDYSLGSVSTFSQTVWSIEPEFGWTIVDKWDIGLDFAYGEGQNVSSVYGFTIPVETYAPFDTGNEAKIMTIAPFVRYYLAKVAGVDVILKGSIFYSKTDLTLGAIGNYDLAVNAYGISIAPIISYSINETWSIGARLNFAELSFMHVETDDKYIKVKNDQFGFNLNDGSLISVGFSYHF